MTTPDTIDALCALPCFRDVPRTAVSALAEACTIRDFSTRDEVMAQGTATDAAYLVVDGMLEVSVQARRSHHHIATISPGEVVGESALFILGVHRNATVLAHKPTRCLEIRPATLRTLAGNRAVMALELYLVAALSRRIRNTNLEIQGAWKQTHPDDFTEEIKPDEGPSTFAGRLKAIFSGRGGDR